MLNVLFLKWYDGNWYCDYDTYLTLDRMSDNVHITLYLRIP